MRASNTFAAYFFRAGARTPNVRKPSASWTCWMSRSARISFTGGYLALEAGDTGKDWFNVWIDREPTADPDRIVTIDRDTTLVLFQAKERKPMAHRIVIQKRTEGEQGRAIFKAFTAEGAFLQAECIRPRVIEFVGDSYTCGYGSENSVREDPFRPADENPSKTYADIIGRYFGADVLHISHSGQGIARNYDDAGRGRHMPDRYRQTFDQQKQPAWDAKDYGVTPALTVIYLATNDVSGQKQPTREAFVQNYLRLIRQAKANYGADHPVLCIVPKGRDLMYDYIKAALAQNKTRNVSYMVLTGPVHDSEGELGASWHPNYAGQLKKAYAILPYVSTLTGWSIEDKALK